MSLERLKNKPKVPEGTKIDLEMRYDGLDDDGFQFPVIQFHFGIKNGCVTPEKEFVLMSELNDLVEDYEKRNNGFFYLPGKFTKRTYPEEKIISMRNPAGDQS